MFSKIRFSNFKKFVPSSVFWQLQLTQILLNFKTSENKIARSFTIILILKKEFMLFVEQKYKL